jgi:hypothetical protein
MKRIWMSMLLILFACCLFAMVLPGTSFADKYYPKKVYITTGDGSLKEVTDTTQIEQLYRDVKSQKCSLTIVGPKSAYPSMTRFRQNDYAHKAQPSDKAVYIISCKDESGDSTCRGSGGSRVCCPPTCY